MTDVIGRFFRSKRGEQWTRDHNAYGMVCGGLTIYYVFCKDVPLLLGSNDTGFPW